MDDDKYRHSLVSRIKSNNTFLGRARKTLVYSAFVTGSILAITAEVPGCHAEMREAADRGLAYIVEQESSGQTGSDGREQYQR